MNQELRGNGAAGKQSTVLIVDDDRDLADVFGDKLSASGFRVLKAYGGRDGVIVARERKPDLTLLDLRMPEVDGKKVLQELRENAATKDMKVILLTAFREYEGDVVNDEFAKRIGADGLIDKQIDFGKLAGRIESFLGR